MAARATRTFAPELTSWAATLRGEQAEIASILASDIADLRAALDLGNPMEEMLREEAESGASAVVLTRTRTAALALLEALGVDTRAEQAGALTVRHVGGLHRQGTWPRAIVVGEPPPWDWHRILSGVAPLVDVLTLGAESAKGCCIAVDRLRDELEHWGSEEVRRKAWTALLNAPPPAAAYELGPRPRASVVLADGAEYVPESDPFEPLGSLFDLDPLDIGGEGPKRGLARESERGEWSAAVAAVAVLTDRGKLLLEIGEPVDVRVGLKIEERPPEQLKAGDILLVGRKQGRVGLLQALEERLGHRPDLVAARYLLEDYRRLVRTRWLESRMTIAALHRAVSELGCDKTSHAVRSWVTETTMAPQHFDDLERLNSALGLGMSDENLHEVFAGVQRRRGFRRAAGRALAAAARDSTVVEVDRVDPATGLSIADLRDAVVEATVITVSPCDDPIPIALLGTLESS